MSPLHSHSPDNHVIRETVLLIASAVWIVLGPAALAITTIQILEQGSGWATSLDFAFLIIVGVILMARWVELRLTATDPTSASPVSPTQFSKFARGLLLVAALVWSLSNAVGNHVLN